MINQASVIRALEQDWGQGIFEYYLANGIKNENDLGYFIEQFFGFRIPNAIKVPGHSTPFAFVADCFFDRADKILCLANRNGGKTQDVAIVNFLDMLFKPGIEITSAGAVVEQAGLGFKYLEQLSYKPKLDAFVTRIRRSPYIIEMQNSSQCRVITASEEGFNGPHPHRSNVDEVDLIGWDQLQEAFSMTKSDDRFRAQDRLLSTRKSMTGTMAKLIRKSKELGLKVHRWGIFEVLERCPDSRRCERCVILDKCEKRAKECKGYYKINDFVNKVQWLDRKTWEFQWECLERETEGMFYNISKERHFWSVKEFCKKYRIDYSLDKDISELIPSGWRRIGGLDFGKSDPCVILCCAVTPDDKLIVYKEFYQRGLTGSNFAKMFLGEIEVYGYPKYDYRIEFKKADDYLMADPSGAVYIAEVLDRDPNVPILRANNSREFGYECVRQSMETDLDGIPNLIILETCPNTFNEHVELRHADSVVNRELPDPKCLDHTVDALRYASAEHKRALIEKTEGCRQTEAVCL